jgi:hypothetical protein
MRNLNFIISDYLYMVRMMRRDQRRLNEVKRTKDKVYQTLQKEQFSLGAVWNKHFVWNLRAYLPTAEIMSSDIARLCVLFFPPPIIRHY